MGESQGHEERGGGRGSKARAQEAGMSGGAFGTLRAWEPPRVWGRGPALIPLSEKSLCSWREGRRMGKQGALKTWAWHLQEP